MKSEFSVERTKWLLTVALIIYGVLEYIQIARIFPITDGWWETYAFASNGGGLYENTKIKFPPLFVLIINFLYNYIGLDMMGEKYVFLIIRLLTIYITYLWLSSYVDKTSSIIGATAAALLIFSNPVYLTKDYHSVVALLVASLLYSISLFDKLRKVRLYSIVICYFIGCLLSLIFMTKQNIGVFISLGALFYYCKSELFDKKPDVLKISLDFAAALIGVVLIISWISHVSPGWTAALYANESKGNLTTVLFRLFFDKYIRLYLVVAFIFFAISIYIIKFRNELISGFVKKYFIQIFFIIFAATNFYSIAIICFALIWPILLPKLKVVATQRERNITILLYAYAYCGTNTAGFNFVTTDYLIAYMVSSVVSIYRANNNLKSIKNYTLILLGILYLTVGLPKVFATTGYNWWGLKSGGVTADRKSMPYSDLGGITSDSETVEIFETVKKYNIENLRNKEDVFFAYPSIPIFYLLEKQKPIGSPVLWFDVSTKNDADYTIAELERKKPKIIYWLRPPKFVYYGHFNLRKIDPAMIDIDNWIFDQIENKKYKVIKALPTYDENHKYATKFTTIKTSNYKFENGVEYVNYIKLLKEITDSDEYVFYVLLKND